MSTQEQEEMLDGTDSASSVAGAESTRPEDLRILEALLFASDELMTAARLKTILPGQPDARKIRQMVEKINVQLQKERHPFEIVEIGGGYQFRTITFYHPWVRQIFKEKAVKKLSIQALECLAIIAYKQPISKADIEAIRGVVSDGAMKTLLEKRLVTISGRSEKPGRPLLYTITHVFLTYFGINKIEDLPRIEEFEALAKEKMEDLSLEELANQDVVLDEEAALAASDQAAATDMGESSVFEVEILPDAEKNGKPAVPGPDDKEETAVFIDTSVVASEVKADDALAATELFEVTGNSVSDEEVFDIESVLEDIPKMQASTIPMDAEVDFEPSADAEVLDNVDVNAATAVIVPQEAPDAGNDAAEEIIVSVNDTADIAAIKTDAAEPEVMFEKAASTLTDRATVFDAAAPVPVAADTSSDATVFDFEKPAGIASNEDEATVVFEIEPPQKRVARFTEEDEEIFGGALMETKAIKPDKLADHSKKRSKATADSDVDSTESSEESDKKSRKRKGD